jgi:hypothetical protein
MVGAIDQLHEAAGHFGFVRGMLRLFGKEAGRAGVRRVSLGDDGISRRDRSREIASGDSIKGKRKIIRPEHDHRADGGEDRANICLGVDDWPQPRTAARRRGRLPQLVRRPRQFRFGQPRFDRQGRFLVRQRHDLRGPGFDTVGVAFEKTGKTFARPEGDFAGGLRGSLHRCFNLPPGADGINVREWRLCRRIERLKCLCAGGGPPHAIDQNGLCAHRNNV